MKHLKASMAAKVLSIWLTPDGNNNKAVEEMCHQLVEWADKVHAGHLWKADVQLSFTSMLCKCLEYPLPALTLLADECHRIELPAICQVLLSMGICCSFPRSVVHGPMQYQGLGMPSLYKSQGLVHLQAFQKHGGLTSIMGQLLGASIQWLKVEIVTRGPLFHSDFGIFGRLVTPSWVAHLWQYAHSKRVWLDEDTPSLALCWEGNAFLML